MKITHSIEQQQRIEIEARLAAQGFEYLYGGGSDDRQKGHGWWLYKGGVNVPDQDCEKYGNSNPCFWMYGHLAELYEVTK